MCLFIGVLCEIFVSCLFIKEVRRDSSVSLATRYWLDGEWIEFPWGVGVGVGEEKFRTRPDGRWGPASLLYSVYLVFNGSKAVGVWH
jgi:hypothetical protein